MTQKYLAIARAFRAERGVGAANDLAVEAGLELAAAVRPIQILEYRADGTPRRCRICRHVLSVVAIRDICGRCATPKPESTTPTEPPSTEALLRGRALVALDRRGYPNLELSDGHSVGQGILRWAPVLRGMDETELEKLMSQLATLQPSASVLVDEE